jgi:hypothetical protein
MQLNLAPAATAPSVSWLREYPPLMELGDRNFCLTLRQRSGGKWGKRMPGFSARTVGQRRRAISSSSAGVQSDAHGTETANIPTKRSGRSRTAGQPVFVPQSWAIT